MIKITPTEWIRQAVNGVKVRLTSAIHRLGLTPNAVTLLGAFFSGVFALTFFSGHFRLAACLIFLVGFCDVLDGQLAMARGTVSRYGAFLDSTVDRISDAFIFLGLILYYMEQGMPHAVVLAFFALMGSFLTSYTRARAELHIPKCAYGFWERPERMVVLILAVAFGKVLTCLWILAIFTNITAVHRMLATYEAIEGRRGSWKTWTGPLAILRTVLFWEFRRYVWQYDAYVVGVLLWIFLI